MEQHIKLKEIIFEITDACFQNCSYCGSKDDINKTPIDNDNIIRIVDNIASYPPDEIDISGGNPLLVDKHIHGYLTETLKTKNVICKILVNPFNVKTSDIKTLQLYDWVGVSINNMAELNRAMHGDFVTKFGFTVITNFNTSNVFLFKAIEDFVVTNKLQWQIQYTMYKGENELALYDKPEAVNFFMSMIDQSSARIIKADNANQGKCSAGMASIGILASGFVVPCLSMRAWEEDTLLCMGNLLEESLRCVWETRFAQYRCREFKCCKDVTKCCDIVAPPVAPETLQTLWVTGGMLPAYTPKPQPLNPNIAMMYGIQQPRIFDPIPWDTNRTCVYAVQVQQDSYRPLPNTEPNVYAYAVIRDNFNTTASDTTKWIHNLTTASDKTGEKE